MTLRLINRAFTGDLLLMAKSQFLMCMSQKEKLVSYNIVAIVKRAKMC